MERFAKSGGSENLEYINSLSLLPLDKPFVVTLLRRAMACAELHYRLAFYGEQTVVYTLENKQLVYHGQSEGGWLLSDFWLPMVSLALIHQDADTLGIIGQLTGIKQQIMSGETNGFSHSVVDLIHCMLLDKPQFAQQAKRTLDLYSPDVIPAAARPYCENIALPFVDLLLLANTKNAEDKYQAALLNALERHKRYYDCKDKQYDTTGCLSWLIMGAAAWAYRLPAANLPYVIDWVVYGDFDKQVSTYRQDVALSQKYIEQMDHHLTISWQLRIKGHLMSNEAAIIAAIEAYLAGEPDSCGREYDKSKANERDFEVPIFDCQGFSYSFSGGDAESDRLAWIEQQSRPALTANDVPLTSRELVLHCRRIRVQHLERWWPKMYSTLGGVLFRANERRAPRPAIELDYDIHWD